MQTITAERLREVLTYDPETGIFTALIYRGGNAPKIGSALGSPGGFKKKYLVIAIDGRKYLCQRLAWLYMTGEWPNPEADHRNRVETDNRWENLREATRTQNCANRGSQTNNTSGHRGVNWHKKSQKWRAFLGSIHLGTFDLLDDAIEVRRRKVLDLYGEFSPSAAV